MYKCTKPINVQWFCLDTVAVEVIDDDMDFQPDTDQSCTTGRQTTIQFFFLIIYLFS